MIEPVLLESSRISPAQETVVIVERKGGAGFSPHVFLKMLISPVLKAPALI